MVDHRYRIEILFRNFAADLEQGAVKQLMHLQERAVAISRQIADRYPVEPSLEQGHVYLLALEALFGAAPQAIDDSFRCVIALHRGEHAL